MVQGEAYLSLLCRGDDQKLWSREITLPFSQILDLDDLPDDVEFFCTAREMEREIHPVRTENGSGYGVTIRICLLVQSFEDCAVDYVTDLYSTRYEITGKTSEVALPSASLPEEVRRDTAQRLDGAGSFVYLTDADCTHPELTSSDGSSPTMRSSVHMKILYLDESGSPVIAERTAEVSGEPGQLPSSLQVCVEPETLQRMGGGFEVRVPVLFRLQRTGREDLVSLISAQMQGEIDRTSMPSLILRRIGRGETLWDLAKQCRTEEQAILAANELENESDISDQMLLIPRIR